ncbi:MAG: hypothetical protein HY905_12420 [Deltaproteobacteria bacterium]|nr:hypothetical protein [Deltaproteobacteria bacterium]
MVEVLRAAGIARATIDHGALVLEPDPVRMGRSWGEPDVVRTATALGALSPAFAAAARQVVYLFVDFVRREGLRRTHRENAIPKGPAAKLAGLLSWADEAAAVKEDGHGLWSDKVSRVARDIGLVTFEVKGVYAGYSSQSESFPENDIEVNEKRLAAWLAQDPVKKERAILEALVRSTASEFFHHATLWEGERFDGFGCATGPASRMDLPAVRNGLLAILADLPVGDWLPVRGLIDLVHRQAPTLILDPKLREPLAERWMPYDQRKQKKTASKLEDLYTNFREHTVRDRWGQQDQLAESTPDVFSRVEGRYIQFFLEEIPWLCGFVDLALPPERRPKPDDRVPPLEWIRAFRLTPRLRQVVRSDPELARVKVTVLPNFEVVVEAPSFPDRELDALSPFCVRVKEDGPTHLLRLDRKTVVTLAASRKTAPPVPEVLQRLAGTPPPANVAAEIRDWLGQADKLVVYEDCALVELRGAEGLSASVRDELGALVAESCAREFLLARKPERTVSVLEQRGRAPLVVIHRKGRFATCDGPLGAGAAPLEPAANVAVPAPKKRVRLTVTDLVGYRCDDPALLAALHASLQTSAACQLVEREGLLLVPATDLPKVRAALKRLENRFDVDLAR